MEKPMRKVGKGAEPTKAELRFIYERLDRLNDGEILNEMQEDTEFPVREKPFIVRRRKEFDVARNVLIEQLARQVDPVLADLRRKHWETLQGVARQVVDCIDEMLGKSPEEAKAIRQATIEAVNDLHCRLLFDHLKAEFPDDFKGVDDLLDFFKLGSPGTDKIALVSERGAFMGACDVCRGWYEGEIQESGGKG